MTPADHYDSVDDDAEFGLRYNGDIPHPDIVSMLQVL